MPIGERDDRPRRLAPRTFLAGATLNGAQSGEQFPRVERFGQVIVGAQFQADDAVAQFTHRGQHDDCNVRLRA
ncbi:hypothetical protein D3C81_1700570 [compost metagenome]